MSAFFDMGGLAVGAGASPLFLPDIGTFFNRDADLALGMVDALIAAGVRIVKGEILHDPSICLDDDTEIPYLGRDGSAHAERYRSLIERKAVPLAEYDRIFGRVRDRGIPFVVSVYDRVGLDFAVETGACSLKIATSNIVHQPLIEQAARSGLPIILDTGDSSLEEVDRAVQWARDVGAQHLLVEHSPYPPPAPVDRHDLRFMIKLGEVFGLPYGLSDHHAGDEMLYGAVALGASVVEKGVCPDGLLVEQDVAHALPLSQVPSVVAKCDNVHRALGHAYRPLRRDRARKLSRMGLVAARDLRAGEVLGEGNVTFAFPARGIPVENWQMVRAWKLRRDLAAGQPITWADVQA